jgi:hypothetical protein
VNVRFRGPQSIYVVGVCYQLPPAQFIDKLQTLASRNGIRLRGIVVSNNVEHPLTSRSPDMEVIPGSNEHLDFSGYFEGLERLATVLPDAASGNVLFINDSLFVKHAAGCILRRVLGLDMLLGQLKLPAIGGKVDPYRSICLRNPWSGHIGYVTSFCFLLNASAQPMLRSLLAHAAADGVLTAAQVNDAMWGAQMLPVMREHIRAHLTYEGSPYLWRSTSGLDADVVRKKARCVYFEGRLSGAIGAEGALVPINSGPRSRTDIFLHESMARIARIFQNARQ